MSKMQSQAKHMGNIVVDAGDIQCEVGILRKEHVCAVGIMIDYDILVVFLLSMSFHVNIIYIYEGYIKLIVII